MANIAKILIANRGEIVIRIAATARKCGIHTVGIYATADRNSGFYKACDTAWELEGETIADTYLNIDQIIAIAKKSGCNAIHPGYGFLSENPAFARACMKNGLIFIGPRAETLELMGNKLMAKKAVAGMGVPVIESKKGTGKELQKLARQMDYPVLIKAAAGGGGKGLRIANDEKQFAEQLQNAEREAKAYFGDPTLYVEHYLEEPRHIEVQVLGDDFGNVVHLYHRECSLQRRFQKIIEEAPAVSISDKLSNEMLDAAVTIARQIQYTNAGTIEFLVDKKGRFYFLEMNTRIQVEHPVTEMVTGIDIVAQQIRIAEGKKLSLRQKDITVKGHAVESRLYAEDPVHEFKPSPGKIHYFRAPHPSLARTDTWVGSGTVVLPHYDSLLAKIITHRTGRREALEAHLEALKDLKVVGIETNLLFLKELVKNEKVLGNEISTTFVERNPEVLTAFRHEKKGKIHHALAAGALMVLTPLKNARNVWEEIGFWRALPMLDLCCDGEHYRIGYAWDGRTLRFSTKDKDFHYKIISQTENNILLESGEELVNVAVARENGIFFMEIDGYQFQLKEEPEITVPAMANGEQSNKQSSKILSAIPGTVSRVYVKNGQKVMEGDHLFIIEAMKMDNYITSDRNGIVKEIKVKEGRHIAAGQVLLEFEMQKDE